MTQAQSFRLTAITLVTTLVALCLAPVALAVTIDVRPVNERNVVGHMTTHAAIRAESDVQVRRIKTLLAEKKVDSETFFSKLEKIRQKLGQ